MEQTCHKRRTSKCARRGPTGWMCSAGPSDARRPPLRSVRIRFGLFRFCLTLVFFWGRSSPRFLLPPPRGSPRKAAGAEGTAVRCRPAQSTRRRRALPCRALPRAPRRSRELLARPRARPPRALFFPVRPLPGDALRPGRRNAARAILVGCGRRAGNGRKMEAGGNGREDGGRARRDGRSVPPVRPRKVRGAPAARPKGLCGRGGGEEGPVAVRPGEGRGAPVGTEGLLVEGSSGAGCRATAAT